MNRLDNLMIYILKETKSILKEYVKLKFTNVKTISHMDCNVFTSHRKTQYASLI